MSRNGDDVHCRLQQAALELFCERGYDQTTAAEIAVRAGVTEDKRPQCAAMGRKVRLTRNALPELTFPHIAGAGDG
jgi:Bacterial regulatory proteins, tetR family